MFAGILVLIGLSFLVFAHEAGHFIVAKLCGMRVDEFGFGFPPRLWAKKIGDTEYSINWLPFGGFVRIRGEHASEVAGVELSQAESKELFERNPAWKKIAVLLAGVSVNAIFGWLLISVIFMIGTPSSLFISSVEKGSPAETAGFLPGDMIKDYANSKDFIAFVNAHRGEEVSLVLIRAGGEIAVKVRPRTTTEAGKGAIGVYLGEGGTPKQSFFGALKEGFLAAINIFWLTLVSFYSLIKNLFFHASLLPGVVGPVGIFSIARQTSEMGFIYFIQLLSIISLNLAAMNLIPFPALDGGRFVLVIIEKIKRSPLSQTAQSWANGIGFAFLLLLMVLLTVRDVAKIF